jgi:hypothetical protein
VQPVAPPVDDSGVSLSDRIAAADTGPTAPPADDSIDEIRNAAVEALEEARLLKGKPDIDTSQENDSPINDGPSVDVLDDPPKVDIDYSPSVEPPVRIPEADESDEEPKDDQVVESRYKRNSARLPRIGIEPGSSSDTIKNLRKQILHDD